MLKIYPWLIVPAMMSIAVVAYSKSDLPTTKQAAPEEKASRTAGQPVKGSEAAHAQPTTLPQSNERIKVPFQDVLANFDIGFPEGARFRVTGAIGDRSAMMFEKPVHPTGNINSLQISKRSIVLKNTALKDGLLTTTEFGDIEFLLLGPGLAPGQWEMRATQAQISKIAEWLKK